MNDTLKHALGLTTFGFSIIPIDGKTKKPLIEWQKYQTIPATKEEIKDWFEKYPEAGIAIVTGKISGICVVDIDPRNNQDWENALFIKYDTVSVKTGGGGYHYYFAYPKEGIKSHPGFIKGVDFKSDGGYVICPPSKHPSGETYEWIKSPSKAKILELPFGIKETIERSTLNSPSTFDLSSLGGVPEGQRNEVAAKVVGKLLRNATQQDLPLVWQLFISWNEKNIPPMKESELKSVFDSIWTKEQLAPKQISNNVGNPYRGGGFLSSVPIHISELTEELSQLDWIWEGYLAKGHLSFFSALWKVGKSTLISYLLKAIQEEKEFAGKIVKPTKVLILSEESKNTWARRKEDLNLTGDIYLSCRPVRTKLTEKEWLHLIEDKVAFCTSKGIELLIIDTVSTFWSVRDEGNNPELDAALLPLNIFLEKGICVMIVHHFRKSGGSEGTATRGGGGIGSRADILIEYTRLNPESVNDPQRVLRSYSRFEETPPELVIELTADGFIPRGTKSEVSKELKMQNVLKILQEQANLTVKEIAQAWDTDLHGPRPTDRTIRNYIYTLLNERRINQTGKQTVGKTEAPAFSINNIAGKERSLSIENSSDMTIDQMKPEKIMEVFKNAA